MRFLCLHGSGTNSEIFKAQTGTRPFEHDPALRYRLNQSYIYEFVDGSTIWPALPGIEDIFGPQEECYACFDPSSATSIQSALRDLKDYLAADGPFDAVMAFSQGASLAALFLVDAIVNRTEEKQRRSEFKCAIFLSGIVPCDVEALSQRSIRWLDPRVNGEIIKLPTAHIWGSNDSEYLRISEGLSMLCGSENRKVVVHKGGHEIPGSQDESLTDMVNAIEETIGLAVQLNT